MNNFYFDDEEIPHPKVKNKPRKFREEKKVKLKDRKQDRRNKMEKRELFTRNDDD